MKNKSEFLKNFLEQDIYLIPENHAAYQADTDTQGSKKLQEPEIKYSGNISSGVMVILDEEATDNDLSLLSKILAAVKLDLENVALVRVDENIDENLEAITKFDSLKIISFGAGTVKNQLLDIHSKYAPTTIGGHTVIISDKLSELDQNQELKKRLWNTLKEIF